MKDYSDIAQLVEQVTVNHWVPGSSPGVGAINYGEVAERSKALVLKTSVGQPTVGSNPTLSATNRRCNLCPA